MQLNCRNCLCLLCTRVWLVRLTFWFGAIAVGLAASLFAIGADKSQAVFTHLLGYLPWLPLLLTPLTMAGVVWITRRYFSGAEDSGIPQVIAMLHCRIPACGGECCRCAWRWAKWGCPGWRRAAAQA